MDLETFKGIIQKVKSPPLFALEHDRIPTMETILDFQKQYHIVLPKKYIQFLLNFGGGYFGFTNIYSLDQDSYFFIFNRNPATVNDLLFMSDNGCGDYYAFHVEGGRCSEKILFCDHEDNTVRDTGFSDVFEYLVKTGLNRQS